jgi:hypothetical protein
MFGEYRNEPPSKVMFDLVPGGEVVRLTMVHDDLQENSAVYRACSAAWPMILSSLKTLLETGAPLPEFKAEPK